MKNHSHFLYLNTLGKVKKNTQKDDDLFLRFSFHSKHNFCSAAVKAIILFAEEFTYIMTFPVFPRLQTQSLSTTGKIIHILSGIAIICKQMHLNREQILNLFHNVVYG